MAEVAVSTAERKSEHIRICLEEDVESTAKGNGLDEYRFDHQALPELDFNDVDPATTLLGKALRWPFLVGSMTGGTQDAGELNRLLAQAAQRAGCGMALGSLRPALEDPDRVPTFDARTFAPELPLLLGNLGIAQLRDRGMVARLPALCETLRLDGIIIHLNPLQEVLQPEGDTCFHGLLDRLVDLKGALGLPVAVKEVGSGLSPGTLERLKPVDPDMVETAGVGGTSWIRVEGLRSGDPVRRACAADLADWGHTLADSMASTRRILPRAAVLASGGLRTGLDLARALRLGASAGAMALPLLKAADQGAEALDQALRTVLFELCVVMFGTGSRDLAQLRYAPMLDALGKPVPDSSEPDRS